MPLHREPPCCVENGIVFSGWAAVSNEKLRVPMKAAPAAFPANLDSIHRTVLWPEKRGDGKKKAPGHQGVEDPGPGVETEAGRKKLV